SHNPVLGMGWNSWGWAKSDENPRLALAIDPHNGLLWLVAETGAVGLILLYAIPAVLALARPWALWLWAVPLVATLLELVNPNLRNGHFAVVVWALIALAMLAPASVLRKPATPQLKLESTPEPESLPSEPQLSLVDQWRQLATHSAAWLRRQ
ncbi:MAG: hypothetical protein ACRDTD_31655, partial [Pseudonocardiaceae bacterium]